MTVPRRAGRPGPPGRPGRPGRPPGAAGTRDRILGSARVLFGERGYEGATVRAVAARAGVDAALVHHYYGTKQQLFLAAMEIPVDFATVVPSLVAGSPEEVGHRFARFVLGLWDRPELRPLLLGLVRSAATDPVAAGMLRRLLTEGPMLALVTALERPDAELRASLAGSQLIGVLMARYVVGVEPLASLDAESLVATVGPTIQRYLAGDLASPCGPAGAGPARLGADDHRRPR